jgi:hypothetical protein
LPPPVIKHAAAAVASSGVAAPQAAVLSNEPSIVGKVSLDGTPPTLKPISIIPQCAAVVGANSIPDDQLVVGKDKAIKNVIVVVTQGLPKGPYPVRKDPAIIDQKGCHYEPHILAVQTGQPVLARNSDPFLHNIHGLPDLNPGFNFSQANVDPGKPLPAMRTSEKFRVKCDVHPWMSSMFVVFDHPYFAVTKDDGTYTIAGLPPGNYTITTWHEMEDKIEMAEQQVKVEAGKPTEANFNLKLK